MSATAGQRLADAHPRAQQQQHHVMQAGFSTRTTQHQTTLIVSTIGEQKPECAREG
jgi:hypothetical protein